MPKLKVPDLPGSVRVQKPFTAGGRDYEPGSSLKWREIQLTPAKVLQMIKYRFLVDPFNRVPKRFKGILRKKRAKE